MQKLRSLASSENSELLKILSLHPGAGQIIALHALPTAKNSSCPICTYICLFGYSTSSPTPPPSFLETRSSSHER